MILEPFGLYALDKRAQRLFIDARLPDLLAWFHHRIVCNHVYTTILIWWRAVTAQIEYDQIVGTRLHFDRLSLCSTAFRVTWPSRSKVTSCGRNFPPDGFIRYLEKSSASFSGYCNLLMPASWNWPTPTTSAYLRCIGPGEVSGLPLGGPGCFPKRFSTC